MLFCFLLSTTVASWTYAMCKGEWVDDCPDNYLNNTAFSIESINSIYKKDPQYNKLTIKNDEEGPLDINISFDNLNYDIEVYFLSVRNIIDTPPTLTIETSIKTYSNITMIAKIIATDYNVVIDNKNTDLPKNTIFVGIISFSSIKSSDNRELKIVSAEKSCSNYYSYSSFYSDKFGKSVTLQTFYSYFFIQTEPKESQTISIEPILYYKYYSYNNCNINSISGEYFKYQSDFDCTTSINCNVTYGKKKVTLFFSNQKTITFLIESQRVGLKLHLKNESIITCEDGLSSNDIICPLINSDRSTGSKGVVLKGNWPNIKTCSAPKEYYGKGLWIDQLYLNFNFEGLFIYEAENFPVEFNRWSSVNAELVLTKNKSSISGIFKMDNLTISLQNDVDTEFFINGEVSSAKNWYNDGDQYISYLGVLKTNSSKLKVYVQTINEDFIKEGPASVFFQTIDNSHQEIKNTELNLSSNGKVINPYTLFYDDIGNSFDNIYKNYIKSQKEPNSGSSYRVFYDYYINFAKTKASELSTALETLANRFPILNINPPPNGDNYNIIFSRNDYPVASLYKLSLNEQLKSVCAKSGTLDKSKVKTTFGSSFVEGIKDTIGDDDFDIDKYLPIISEQTMTGNDFISEDNKCIGFKPTSIPGSSVEFFFYTSNTTYIEILEKIKIISLLTPNNLEAKTKLFNPKSKNIFIACMDDTPSGKALNFKDGIREDANIFLFGIPFKAFDDVMNTIEYIDNLNESDLTIDYDKIFYSNITDLITKYQTYIPKVNLLLGKVQTLMTIFVDFIGTNIECSNFFTLGSTFSQVDKLTLNAATTIAETESYKSLQIGMKSFNNLFILPIHINPPNLLEINTIQFSNSEWLLKYDKSSLNDNDHFMVETPGEFKIDSSHVVGNLVVFSITKGVDFCISDKLTGTVVKGAGIITDYTTFMDVKSIPGMMVLEDINFKAKEDKKKSIRDLITEEGTKIFKILTKSFINNKEKKENSKENKNNKGNRYQNHKVLKEGSESETTKITFTGWGRITEVKGEMKIDVGKSSIEADRIPKAVMEVVDFRSEEEIKLTPVDSNTLFTNPQIISSIDKKYTFPKGQTVAFTNITFHDANAQLSSSSSIQKLSLSINIGTNVNSEIITDHLKITQATIVDIDTTPITVKKSIEVGPESKFTSKALTATNTKLIMNYKLSAEFANLPDNYEPASITLRYIGESITDELVDYSQYLGAIYNIRTFSDKDKCNKWKSVTTMESEYKDFQQGSSLIQLLCFEQKSTSSLTTTGLSSSSSSSSSSLLSSTYILQLNVTEIPTSEKPEIDNNQPKSGEGKEKPVGAIVGGVIGGIAAIAIIIVLVWFFVFRNKKIDSEDHSNSKEENIP